MNNDGMFCVSWKFVSLCLYRYSHFNTFIIDNCGSVGAIYTIMCLKSVVVLKLQVAILARSAREMSHTDRIV